MRIDAVSIGKNVPHDVNVIIEVPVGGEPIKYEMDKEAGTLVVDRFLYTPMRYPGNYGFIPHTLSDDGDPCDVLIINTRAIIPGAVMSVILPGGVIDGPMTETVLVSSLSHPRPHPLPQDLWWSAWLCPSPGRPFRTCIPCIPMTWA